MKCHRPSDHDRGNLHEYGWEPLTDPRAGESAKKRADTYQQRFVPTDCACQDETEDRDSIGGANQ